MIGVYSWVSGMYSTTHFTYDLHSLNGRGIKFLAFVQLPEKSIITCGVDVTKDYALSIAMP